MRMGAVFSKNRKYRYTLFRIWEVESSGKVNDTKYVVFIGLNPSTADETVNDPTITRCINYVKAWGYGGMYMLNLFAWRATDPKEMKKQGDPRGAENNHWILHICTRASMIVAAWGTHGTFLNRHREVLNLLDLHNVWCLGVTKDGIPKHPLYLKADLKPVMYKA